MDRYYQPVRSAIERANWTIQLKSQKHCLSESSGSSKPGDLVFDCFMGSGTTQAVAMKLGRRFIGADINLGAVQITTKRLLQVAEDLAATKTTPRSRKQAAIVYDDPADDST